MPKGWNKTCADLFQEMEQGKRLIATEEEIEWALAYERSLLPASTLNWLKIWSNRCSEPGDDAPVDNRGSVAPGR